MSRKELEKIVLEHIIENTETWKARVLHEIFYEGVAGVKAWTDAEVLEYITEFELQ